MPWRKKIYWEEFLPVRGGVAERRWGYFPIQSDSNSCSFPLERLRGKKSTHHNFIDSSFADERIHYRKSPYRAPPSSRIPLPARLRDQPSSYPSAQKLTRWSSPCSHSQSSAKTHQSNRLRFRFARSLSKTDASWRFWSYI